MRGGVRARLRVVATTVLLSCVALPARADTTETAPFGGVRWVHSVSSEQNIQLLIVDLCAPGVSLRATAESERGRRVSSFGALVRAQAAVNGDFFGSGFATDGIAMSGGVAWGGADHGYVGPVTIGSHGVMLVPHELVAGPEPWAREIVSGHPTLVSGGVIRDNSGDTGLCTARHPRTAVGLSADRRTLILAVVDGRAPGRLGMTCNELGNLMAFLGAADAVNLDGGGSSTMWIAGAGVVNRPSDGTERTVGNHLALFATGAGEPSACPVPRFAGEYVRSTGFPGGTAMTLEAGSDAHGCLEYRNVGRAPWAPGVTNLGTTMPRDRDGVLRARDWLGANRLATVDHATAPGETGLFCFSVHAPSALGEHVEHFNLVQEAVTWFSDAGGAGDEVNWVSVTSVAPAPPPPPPAMSAADAGRPAAARDGGVASATDASARLGAPPARPMDESLTMTGGCSATGAGARGTAPAVVLAGLALAALSRARRRRRAAR